MSRKLLLLGGLSAASIATITPTGIHLHKEIKYKRKAEKERKEREIFISKSDASSETLNNSFYSQRDGTFVLNSSYSEDKWKFAWIYDAIKSSTNKTQSTLEEFQKSYWEQIKTNKKVRSVDIDEQYITQADAKSQYWEKFKEMCLILTANGKITDKNTNPSQEHLNLCVWLVDTHKKFYEEEYQQTQTPKSEVMEYFWTKYVKNAKK